MLCILRTEREATHEMSCLKKNISFLEYQEQKLMFCDISPTKIKCIFYGEEEAACL